MTLTPTATPLTMSTLEIAELTGKQHKDVLYDTRKMFEGLEIDSADASAQYKDRTGRTLPMFNLDKEECLTLLHGYKFMSNEAYSKVVEYFKDVEITPKFVRKEYSFGEDIVKKLFDGYTVISQFSVLGKYKLDWYIPELKLAIEFDEQHHKSSKAKDEKRQKDIEKALGCKFLRYKDN